MFSVLYMKKRYYKSYKVITLKLDLDLIRIKWCKIVLNYIPKFNSLSEHVSDIFLNLKRFYEMGKNTI